MYLHSIWHIIKGSTNIGCIVIIIIITTTIIISKKGLEIWISLRCSQGVLRDCWSNFTMKSFIWESTNYVFLYFNF